MAQAYCRAQLRVAVAQLCQNLGWNAIQGTPMELLTDILERYLSEIGKYAHRYSEQFGRTEPNLDDLGLSFQELGIDVDELIEYTRSVDPVPFAHPVKQFPVPKETLLAFPPPHCRELLEREEHVNDHLPTMHEGWDEEIIEPKHTVPVSPYPGPGGDTNFHGAQLLSPTQQVDEQGDKRPLAMDDANQPLSKKPRMLPEEAGHSQYRMKSVCLDNQGLLATTGTSGISADCRVPLPPTPQTPFPPRLPGNPLITDTPTGIKSLSSVVTETTDMKTEPNTPKGSKFGEDEVDAAGEEPVSVMDFKTPKRAPLSPKTPRSPKGRGRSKSPKGSAKVKVPGTSRSPIRGGKSPGRGKRSPGRSGKSPGKSPSQGGRSPGKSAASPAPWKSPKTPGQGSRLKELLVTGDKTLGTKTKSKSGSAKKKSKLQSTKGKKSASEESERVPPLSLVAPEISEDVSDDVNVFGIKSSPMDVVDENRLASYDEAIDSVLRSPAFVEIEEFVETTVVETTVVETTVVETTVGSSPLPVQPVIECPAVTVLKSENVSVEKHKSSPSRHKKDKKKKNKNRDKTKVKSSKIIAPVPKTEPIALPPLQAKDVYDFDDDAPAPAKTPVRATPDKLLSPLPIAKKVHKDKKEKRKSKPKIRSPKVKIPGSSQKSISRSTVSKTTEPLPLPSPIPPPLQIPQLDVIPNVPEHTPKSSKSEKKAKGIHKLKIATKPSSPHLQPKVLLDNMSPDDIQQCKYPSPEKIASPAKLPPAAGSPSVPMFPFSDQPKIQPIRIGGIGGKDQSFTIKPIVEKLKEEIKEERKEEKESHKKEKKKKKNKDKDRDREKHRDKDRSKEKKDKNRDKEKKRDRKDKEKSSKKDKEKDLNTSTVGGAIGIPKLTFKFGGGGTMSVTSSASPGPSNPSTPAPEQLPHSSSKQEPLKLKIKPILQPEPKAKPSPKYTPRPISPTIMEFTPSPSPTRLPPSPKDLFPYASPSPSPTTIPEIPSSPEPIYSPPRATSPTPFTRSPSPSPVRCQSPLHLSLSPAESPSHMSSLPRMLDYAPAVRKPMPTTPPQHTGKHREEDEELDEGMSKESPRIMVPTKAQQKAPPAAMQVLIETVGSYKDEHGQTIWICPTCKKQDDGSPMIGCDNCDDWYHWPCVGVKVEPPETQKWYCTRCQLLNITPKGRVGRKKKPGRKKKAKP